MSQSRVDHLVLKKLLDWIDQLNLFGHSVDIRSCHITNRITKYTQEANLVPKEISERNSCPIENYSFIINIIFPKTAFDSDFFLLS